MTQSIYLHREIVAVLRCFGELSDVVNKILEAGAQGNYDITNKPSCPNRTGAGRYDVNIVEPNYLELLDVYGPFSSTISIRRLIYWFVDNEIYQELGWESSTEYVDKYNLLLNKKLQNSLNELEHASKYATTDVTTKISNICNEIKELQEYIKNGN